MMDAWFGTPRGGTGHPCGKGRMEQPNQRAGGFTIIDVMMTICIAAILWTLAAPAVNTEIARVRVRAASNTIAGDLAHVRSIALRDGVGAVMLLEPAADCVPRFRGRRAGHLYRVGTRGQGVERMRRVDLRDTGGRVCAEMNGDDTLTFTSRGMPRGFTNRTIWVWQGATTDSLTLSAVGRVLRVR